jgi:transcriptional regulator with XRE-family HTH domain
MTKSKQTANTRLVAVPQQTPAPHLERQLAQTRLRTIVHVADGHATASDLAAKTGVSQAHMSNVLTGRRNMSPALADRLNEVIDSHERAHAHPFGGKAA